MTSSTSKNVTVTVQGVALKKHVLLADVNIPYKFSIDLSTNTLIFCINADQFSDQSFHSVLLNLDTGSTTVVPSIRNGFASAVDQTTGTVYLGGSDGIFTYNFTTNDIDKPAILSGIDIFDMYFKEHLYYVDTASQALHVYRNGESQIVIPAERHRLTHFAFDDNGNIYFINSNGLFIHRKGYNTAEIIDNSGIQYRGVAFNSHGRPHMVAQDGIYMIKETRPQLILPVDNAFALAFDKNDNLVFSDERSVTVLHCSSD